MKRRIINLVSDANPTRKPDNIDRRILKLFEEIGELSQAYLAATSSKSHKKKTLADVREEAVDVMIVAIDIALTITPMEKLTFDEYEYESSFFDLMVGLMCQLSSDVGIIKYNEGVCDTQQLLNSVFDIVFHVFGDNELTDKQDFDKIVSGVEIKLEKWRHNRESGMVATDAE